MAGRKVVLIHQIKKSMTNLFDTLDYYRPDYVFLLTSEHYAPEKPDLAVLSIKEKDWRTLGEHVRNIEHVELVIIPDAWHKTTMMEVYEQLGTIKEKSQELAGKDECVFYAGLADGEALMTVGVAFAAVQHKMNIYFTRGRRTVYNKEYVLDIDNLNEISETKSWLDKHYNNPKNLRYLNEIILLEERGEKDIVAARIAENLPFTIEATHQAIRRLDGRGLIETEGLSPKIVHPTDLGRLTIRLFFVGNDE